MDGKNQNGWKEGLSLLLSEGRKPDWTGHLSWTVSLVSPRHVTGWFTLSARSPERWCKQGLELLGRGEKSVLAPPSGLGNLTELRPKADGGLQLHFVILFQMLVIASVVFPLSRFPFPSLSLPYLFSFSYPVMLLCATILLSPNQLRSDLWKYMHEEPWAAAAVLVLNLVDLC